ncbi:MAG: phosphoglycerate kinase [Oligoflexia bacterium]|nr:phosphoglycerate kinase [Oligoflexia bacterium]
MGKIKSIKDIDIKSKRVFIRVDFNCPMKDDGTVADDNRIRAALPTIQYAMSQDAKVILASHLGRPKGKVDLKYTLQGVGEKLAELLNKEVIFAHDCRGEGVWSVVENMRQGDVVLLENLRFYKEEEANDKAFSMELAKLCDVYISDAFGTVHRAHASTAGMAEFVKDKGCGFLVQKEVDNLRPVVESPTHPFAVILGGAKVSDKMAVIEELSRNADVMLIGGAMAYTFLKAGGFNVGKSLVEDDKLELAKKIISRFSNKGTKLLLPVDHIVASELKEGVKWEVTGDENISDGMMGLDIGPKTISLYKDALKNAEMVVWNGPMGVFETKPFDNGTLEVARLLAESKAHTVIGGGDSASAVKKAGVKDRITHVSTGGGASLEYLEGKKLPGLVALEY